MSPKPRLRHALVFAEVRHAGTLRQAATAFGVPVRTLIDAATSGALPVSRITPRRVCVLYGDVALWIRSRRIGVPPARGATPIASAESPRRLRIVEPPDVPA